jgi:hypothetical protein
MTDLVYYIGVDHREPEATMVCEHSARAYSSRTLDIRYLEHLDLRRRQYFDRPWRICEDGTMLDERDGKPFSTQFSHTRFLTPLVAQAEGHTGWALFTDADWLWLEDPIKMLKEVDASKTVMVVPHNYNPTASIKMDNQPQARYNRKLWSACMLWNLKSKHLPTFEMVNEADGGYLHKFGWLDDDQIGYLDEAWQWIPGASPTTQASLNLEGNNQHSPINAVHMTMGIPGMANREPTPFDEMWQNELIDAYRTKF